MEYYKRTELIHSSKTTSGIYTNNNLLENINLQLQKYIL